MKKSIKILSALLSILLLTQVISVGAAPALPTGELTAKSAAKRTLIDGPEGEPFLTEEQAASAGTGEATREDNLNRAPSPIIGEVVELRDESTKHFRHLDGTYTVAVYAEPVHYKDSADKWQNIDNTLSLESSMQYAADRATYTPAASGLDIHIPQDFSDGQMLTVGKDGYTVGLGIKAPYAAVLPAETLAVNEDLASSADEVAAFSEELPVSEALTTSNAIDLSAVKAEVNNDLALEARAIPDSARTTEIESENAKIMELDSLSSSVTYRSIFPGANLTYIVTPSRIKEYITAYEKQDTYEYLFNLSLGGLIAVPQEDGSICLFGGIEDEKPLFILEAPFMYDAAGEASAAVKMSFAEDGTLTLTADAAWINDESRTLPVTIDPTITTSATGIQDAYISGALLSGGVNYSGMTYNYAGKGLLGARRTYLRFTLPTLPDGSVATGAALWLTQDSCDYYSSGKYLYLFDLTGKSSWSASSITWNNQPLNGNENGPRNDGIKIVDYAPVLSGAGTYQYNITRPVKYWYENNYSNNGFMITTSDESNNTQACLYGISCSTVAYRPAVQIAYNTNIGLEDYWSYEAIDLGRSGTAYINDYNGSLTYVHSDLTMSGNRLPISLGHVYNSNSTVYGTYYSGMYTGAKFHLNIQELLIPISTSDALYSKGYRYRHYDADGTVHYYRTNGSKITHEFDETLAVTASGSTLIITDGQNNKKHFNSAGQLFKLEDNDGNAQTFTFNGNRITQITDGAGRTAALNYNAYNQLASIVDPAGRSTTFAYSSTATSANLTSITYPGGKTTSFLYSYTNYISRITAENNAFVTFSYLSTAGCGYRINYAYQYDKASTWVDSLKFEYSITNSAGRVTGNTIVTNKNSKYNVFLFDSLGHATSVNNQDFQYKYSVYNSNEYDPNRFNKLDNTSDLQTISTNILKNHGFEQTAYWQYIPDTGGQLGYSTAYSCRGQRSMRMQDNSSNSWNHVVQDFVAVPGQTYTLSADFYIPQPLQGNGGAVLGLTYNDTSGGWHHELGQPIKSTNGWERHSFTFTYPANAVSGSGNLAVITQSSAAGEFYFDNVQLEKSGGSRLYNLVENSDFSNSPGANGTATGTVPYGWTMSGTQLGDGAQVQGGRINVIMGGSPAHAKKLTQTVPVNAQAGDTLIIGGAAKGNATLDAYNTRKFGIIADIYSTASTKVATIPIDFDRSIALVQQAKATYYTLSTPCHHIVFSFVYYYHVDSVSFDDAFVYVGSFGTNYVYDGKGLIKEVHDHEGELTEYAFSSTKLTEVSQTHSGVKETVAEIGYVGSSYRVDTVTNNEGTEIKLGYAPGDNGQVGSQTITTDDGEKIVESTTYIQGGNYPDTFTDARGGTTKYTYDTTRGLLTKVKDPSGNEITYTYDANTDELLSTSGKANPSTSVTTSFGMQDHLLKTITRNGMSYTNEYDNQNRVTALKVGSQTLVSNTYDTRRRLQQQNYANGAYYTPVYDSRDRQIGEKWNGVQTIEYFYNENDRLSQTVDKTTGVTYKYDYAFFGLLNKVTGSDGSLTAYDYDMSGKLSSLTFSKNGATIHDARYYTDEKGNPEDVILRSLGNTALHYSYDGLGRLTGQSIGPLFTPIEYYAGATPGSTTNLIQNYKNEDGNGIPLQNYTYTYDANGNIKTISDGVVLKASYDYDGLNRLIREDNAWMNKSCVYNYDAGGNLTTVTTHAYTTGTLGVATATENYAYGGNANWKDQMTSHCGGAISYDALGNPVSFVGYTLTWGKGRQLTSFSGNGLNITYAYDASGRRIQQVANGTTINYTYSGDLLMRQIDSEGKVLDFQYDAGGKMVGFMYNGTPYYYLRDLQNDVVAITDTAGNVVGSYTYDAWGNTSISGAIASINPIRYRGYYQDPFTSWHYLNTRYYSCGWRRFINADSMFIAGDDAINASNMYAYCNGNPVMYADPSGKLIIATLWALGNYYGGHDSGVRKVIDAASLVFNFFWEGAWNLGLKAIFGSDFSTISRDSEFGQKLFGGFLNWTLNKGLYYADFVLAPVFNVLTGNCLFNKDWTKRVTGWTQGLQSIVWNFTMAPGARLGAWLLEFFPTSGDPYSTNYATREGQYQWQHFMGYNWYYDFFFSVGGPIDKKTYTFTRTDPGSNHVVYYNIWCWKADYWNLGPGAEIGIYFQDHKTRADRGFYDIDQDGYLKVKTNMKVEYSGGKYKPPKVPYTATIQQTNWWVTLFCPWVDQRVENLNDLQVYMACSFDVIRRDGSGNVIGEYMLDEKGNLLNGIATAQIGDSGARHQNGLLFNALTDINTGWGTKVATGNGSGLSWPSAPNHGTNLAASEWSYLNQSPNYPTSYVLDYYQPSEFDFYIQF